MKNYLLIFFMVLSVAAICGGSGPVSTDTIPARQISIMTYNIKMLPRGANSFIHHFPVRRAKLIPTALIPENIDVIVFQEAFDGLADRILRKKLKSTYPYCMGFKNRKVVSYKRAGGVLIFSKYPLTELESIKYTQCKGIDCMGNKGAMLVEVHHPVVKFQLFGTHMQAGGSKELKQSQYAEAGALLKRHQQPGTPQFVAGDFNTHRNDPLMYDTLRRALDAQDGDITGEQQYSTDHKLNDMDSYNPLKRNLIDFIFYRGNGIKPLSATRYIRIFQQQWHPKHKDLSDHFAVVLKMQL